MNGVTHEYHPRLLYWDRTLWETALSFFRSKYCDFKSFYPTRLKKYTTKFIVTHPHQNYVSNTSKQSAFECVDTGAALKGKTPIMDVDTKEY
jgi:serine/threonine protein phosphatase 1